MKLLLTSVFIFLLKGASAGSSDTLKGILPLRFGEVYYSGVIRVDSTPQKELHNKVLCVLLEIYHFDKEAILVNDKEAGLIVFRDYLGYHSASGFHTQQLWHTLTVHIRDSRIRYEISRFHVRDRIDSTYYRVFTLESYSPVIARKRIELYEASDHQIKWMLGRLQDAIELPEEEW